MPLNNHTLGQVVRYVFSTGSLSASDLPEVDVLIAGLQSYCHQQLLSMQQLNLQLAQLPKLQQGVQDLMNTIGELEGMFEEVELRLVSLEDVIETQALQEKQLDERFKLALYGEKKKGHFESLKEKLEEDHQTLLRQLEEQEQEVLRERQETFGEVFRKDLEEYKEQRTLHRIEAVHEARVDLEDIDLEGNDEEREALDEFLADVISTTAIRDSYRACGMSLESGLQRQTPSPFDPKTEKLLGTPSTGSKHASALATCQGDTFAKNVKGRQTAFAPLFSLAAKCQLNKCKERETEDLAGIHTSNFYRQNGFTQQLV
ncbi:hypothetical protein HPB48_020161 [Haemaphysalis longicornis]|uniref:Uncharacterized protein n=1 Tax=Haemaphysalis longicornis TaxID=44386 RepID=A0A9J6FHE1_HAELO|nr:hypothetical protein HPB48_020161 [Haemaphysalis longicornis]